MSGTRLPVRREYLPAVQLRGHVFAWQDAPAGLLREELSPKPAYECLKRLIRQQWWTPTQTLTTNAQGVASMRGFLGTYRLAIDAQTQVFELTRGKNEWVVRV